MNYVVYIEWYLDDLFYFMVFGILYVFISLVYCIAGVMAMTAVSFSWDGA